MITFSAPDALAAPSTYERDSNKETSPLLAKNTTILFEFVSF